MARLAAAIGLMHFTPNEFFSAISACAVVALARLALA
jgi:hypothetical protein